MVRGMLSLPSCVSHVAAPVVVPQGNAIVPLLPSARNFVGVVARGDVYHRYDRDQTDHDPQAKENRLSGIGLMECHV